MPKKERNNAKRKSESKEKKANSERTFAMQCECNWLLNEIYEFKKVAPLTMTLNSKKSCVNSLMNHLQQRFPEIKLSQNDDNLGAEATLGRTGLKVMFKPDQKELDCLCSQIKTYLEGLDNLVVVFFNADSAIVNNYKEKIEKSGCQSRLTLITI
ncbi:MAG: hypothetical protein ABSF44_07825 [Candidatus Bathyarchaeia archaeon]|jgi:hypothetical protein